MRSNSERLNPDSFHFVKVDHVGSPVIETGRPRRFVGSHLCCDFELSAILQIVRDARRSKRVAAHSGREAGVGNPSFYHHERVIPAHAVCRELLRSTARRSKERTPLVSDNPGGGDVGVKVLLCRVMDRHFVKLASLFVKPDPPPLAVLVIVFDRHGGYGSNPCKRKHHDGHERPVSLAHDVRYVDAVEEAPRVFRREHRRLPFSVAVSRAADGRGRIEPHDLANDEPIEEHPDSGKVLLHRLRRSGVLLDVSRNMHGLDCLQYEPPLLTPMHKVPHGAAVGLAGVLVSDVNGEEFEEPLGRLFPLLGDDNRNRCGRWVDQDWENGVGFRVIHDVHGGVQSTQA